MAAVFVIGVGGIELFLQAGWAGNYLLAFGITSAVYIPVNYWLSKLFNLDGATLAKRAEANFYNKIIRRYTAVLANYHWQAGDSEILMRKFQDNYSRALLEKPHLYINQVLGLLKYNLSGKKQNSYNLKILKENWFDVAAALLNGKPLGILTGVLSETELQQISEILTMLASSEYFSQKAEQPEMLKEFEQIIETLQKHYKIPRGEPDA